MIDVDQFKAINDNFGHVVGDRVLATIGEILPSDVRPFDVVSRLGGDEFAVLLPETDSAAAVQVAERVFRDLAPRTEVPGHPQHRGEQSRPVDADRRASLRRGRHGALPGETGRTGTPSRSSGHDRSGLRRSGDR